MGGTEGIGRLDKKELLIRPTPDRLDQLLSCISLFPVDSRISNVSIAQCHYRRSVQACMHRRLVIAAF